MVTLHTGDMETTDIMDTVMARDTGMAIITDIGTDITMVIGMVIQIIIITIVMMEH